MSEQIKNTAKMKVFPKGQVIIPVSLRLKYNINVGDQIEFTEFQDGILLKPSPKKPVERSVTEQLFGRLRSYAKGSAYPDKNTVNKAMEAEFSEGWGE